MNRSVVQGWVSTLTLKMQTVLLSAIRGPDGMRKECPGKHMTRLLRAMVLHNASPNDGLFMMHPDNITAVAIELSKDQDEYPHHWVLHITHAMQIVGRFHPEHEARVAWYGAYRTLVHSMHFECESDERHDERLADGPISPVLPPTASEPHRPLFDWLSKKKEEPAEPRRRWRDGYGD